MWYEMDFLTKDIVSAVDAESVPQSSRNTPTFEDTRGKCCGSWEPDLDCTESKQQYSGNDKQRYDAFATPLNYC